jgi:peptidoglycan/LPS O-acetylase OafA/YrhL
MNVTLEISRGLAALWVFMFHIKAMIFKVSPLLGKIAKFGALGVPMFFVISGYCLYASASSSNVKGKKQTSFIKRRLLRIYPPFWASIVVVIILPFIIEFISSMKSGTYVSHTPSYAIYGIQDWFQLVSLTKVFFNTDGDLQGAFNKINAVYWSLAIEVQFYLIIYISLLFNKRWVKVLTAVLVLSLISLFSEYLRKSGLFLSFWPAFSCGMALRALHEKGITPEKVFGTKAVFVSCLISACMIIALHYSMLTSSINEILSYFHQFYSEVTIFALFMTVLFWFVGQLESHIAGKGLFENCQLLKIILKPFLMMGAASYSIYLLHAKIYEITEMFSHQLFNQANPLYVLFTIIPTLYICYCFHQIAEKPFMSQNYKKRISNPFVG